MTRLGRGVAEVKLLQNYMALKLQNFLKLLLQSNFINFVLVNIKVYCYADRSKFHNCTDLSGYTFQCVPLFKGL